MKQPMARRLVVALVLVPSAFAACYNPTPPYAPPILHKSDSTLHAVFTALEQDLWLPKPETPALDVAFSVEVTSADETLWSFHQKASQSSAGGPREAETKLQHSQVDEHSVYRIASISKMFTVLAVLLAQDKGLLDLDSPITDYVADLQRHGKSTSKGLRTAWESINLRSLATQLSGIQRESSKMTPMWDLSSQIDRVKSGYPPLSREEWPSCGDSNDSFGCSRQEILEELISQRPVYQPMFKSRYSNLAFVLLGMAVENVTGLAYNNIIQKWIFEPLNMTDASINKPDDSRGQILGKQTMWGLNLGHYNATGGIYSSTHSMSRFLRHILSSQRLRDAWLQPHSFTPGGVSFYGMPWEIYHSPRFLPDHGHRPTTFYTKAGGLIGYYSDIIVMPEQNLGISIFVAGPLERALTMPWIREVVTKRLVPGVEDAALEQMRTRYAGTYAYAGAGSLDSRITLDVARSKGLHVTAWTSNGTDFLAHFGRLYQQFEAVAAWHAKVTPSLLVEERGRRRGEVWRVQFAPEKGAGGPAELWDEFCADDVQGMTYGGRDVNELVFEMDKGEGGGAAALTIEGLRVRLERVREEPAAAAGLGNTSSKAWLQRVLGRVVS